MVRLANENDAKRLAEISFSNVSPAWNETDFLGAIQNAQAIVLVKEDAMLLGYAVCYFAADEGEIPSIAVDASYRRKGIGNELFEALSSYIKEMNITRLFLEVREGNTPAVCFYKSNGFLEVGRRKNFYHNPTEDALVMEKQFT